MKKIILITAFTLTQFFTSQALALKIGYLNTDLLLSKSSQFKASQLEIAKEFQAKDEALKKQLKIIEILNKDLKETRGDLSKSEIKEKTVEILDLKKKLQASAIKLKQQFSLRNKEELQKIQDLINEVIKDFAKSNKFDLILYQGAAFVDESLDITDKIANKLAKK